MQPAAAEGAAVGGRAASRAFAAELAGALTAGAHESQTGATYYLRGGGALCALRLGGGAGTFGKGSVRPPVGPPSFHAPSIHDAGKAQRVPSSDFDRAIVLALPAGAVFGRARGCGPSPRLLSYEKTPRGWSKPGLVPRHTFAPIGMSLSVFLLMSSE